MSRLSITVCSVDNMTKTDLINLVSISLKIIIVKKLQKLIKTEQFLNVVFSIIEIWNLIKAFKCKEKEEKCNWSWKSTHGAYHDKSWDQNKFASKALRHLKGELLYRFSSKNKNCYFAAKKNKFKLSLTFCLCSVEIME